MKGRALLGGYHHVMKSRETFAIVGDVHGHLQLALCTLARWQRERGGSAFDAVFLCGDVGTFTEDAQLDSAAGLSLNSDGPRTCQFMLEDHAVGHAWHHLLKVRGALGRSEAQ